MLNEQKLDKTAAVIFVKKENSIDNGTVTAQDMEPIKKDIDDLITAFQNMG